MMQLFRPLRLFATGLLALTSAAMAQDMGHWSKDQLVEAWGRVSFCRHIYQLPEVKPRLYNFDLKQCNMAEQTLKSLTGKYSAPEQSVLKSRADNHAIGLSYNTSDPYRAVPACRMYCQKITSSKDKHHD